MRAEPSLLSPVTATLSPMTPIKYVYGVSPSGWVHLYAQINATTSLSGYVRASELSGIAAPSPLSNLGQLGGLLQRRPDVTPRFPTTPSLPGTRPRPTEPAPPPVNTSEPAPGDILPSAQKTIFATIGEIAVLTSPAWAPMVLSAIFSPPR